MKTEQAIIKLGQTLWDILGREYIDKYSEDKNGNLVSVSSISVEDIAEELVNAGYGDIKQAQIDILNKLKDRTRTSYVLDDFILGNVVFSKDIDELIEEIENDNTET